MVIETFRWIANLRGKQGDRGFRGPAGTFSKASARSVAAGSPAAVRMSGSEDAKEVEFDIPRGLPGMNAIAADEAVAAYVAAQDSETGAAARSLIDSYGTVRRRVLLFSCDAQSNMSGRGGPFGNAWAPGADAEDPRIFQFPGRGSNAGTLIPATEPLIMHDTATGIGPALVFARALLALLGPEDIIVLVPNAHGGTSVSSPDTLGWRWSVQGNLAHQAVANTKAAIAAAEARWPDAAVSLEAVLWFEGETAGSNNTPPAVYEEDLKNLIAGYRSSVGYGIPDLPFILCQLIPEARAALPARRRINAVHRSIPWDVARTGLVLNDRWGLSNGDLLHANARAHREVYGPGILAEYQRIIHGGAYLPPRVEPEPIRALSFDTIASDDYQRADGPAGSTPIGGLVYRTQGSNNPTVGVVNGHLQFIGGLGASGTSYWFVDAGTKYARKGISVRADGAFAPLVVLEGTPNPATFLTTPRSVLTRVSSSDLRWAVASYDQDGKNPQQVLVTDVPINPDAGIRFEWEHVRAGQIALVHLWIDGVYAGTFPSVTSHTGTAVGAAHAAGSGSNTANYWDNLNIERIMS